VIQAPEVFATERLVMRRPLLSDAADIHEYARDPEATRYMEWRTHTDIRQSVEFLKACAARWESGEEFCWLITVKPESRVDGAIACRVRGHAVDFGYVLNRKYWGQGYATEAARAVVAWAMSLSGVYRVWATCDTENLASVRVLEKTELLLEGRLKRHTIRPNISMIPRDTFVFAKIRDIA
jgi:[ribosomal protein S5]-alanine N-acetyltransferase